MSTPSRGLTWPSFGHLPAVCLFLILQGCGLDTGSSSSVSRSGEAPQDALVAPNVIVFFTDDHGYADLAIQSSDGLAITPHTDRLAREGVLFSHGFVTAPQCSPSRAGMITGVYQGLFGMDNNREGPLPLSQPTLADYLQAAGYRTGMAGKWHLDVDQNNRANLPEDTDENRYKPGSRGFHEYFEGRRNQFLASHDAHGVPVADAPQWILDQRFRIDAATQWGRQFIRRNADGPFFLYMPYFAPHVPLEAPQADLQIFPPELAEKRRTALAMIHAMDRGVGEIIEELTAQGILDRTLVIYAGDNGAATIPHLDNGSRNTPLLGEKGMLTDGGVRVPFLMSWPGHIPSGVTYPHLVSTLDIVPTALSAAAVDLPAGLSGKNLLSALQDDSMPPVRDTLRWRFLTQAAVRSSDWKAIILSDGTEFLFDLRGGMPERDNVREQFPEHFDSLKSELTAWSENLMPPGLPSGALHPGDRAFYSHHGLLPSTASAQ